MPYRSKTDLKPQLNITSRIHRPGRFAKRARSERSSERAELRCVKQVEEVSPKLCSDAFRDEEVLHQPEIDISCPVRAQVVHVPRRVPDRIGCRSGECSGVEPVVR